MKQRRAFILVERKKRKAQLQEADGTWCCIVVAHGKDWRVLIKKERWVRFVYNLPTTFNQEILLKFEPVEP